MTTDARDAAQHWDDAYRHGEASRSWFQDHAHMSLQMMALAGVKPTDSVIDIGGGASRLTDDLLARGHNDLTVLDISADALCTAQQRLASRQEVVHWLHTDIRTWSPDRTWAVWHDRAVLHFFTTDDDKQRYLGALQRATRAGSIAIVGTFAPDGPQQCSGLSVTSYDVDEISAFLGLRWRLLASSSEHHRTPDGQTQPFTWAVFHRDADNVVS